MQALLSFDKAPPFAAPLRFFLTAPLFSLAAGLLLLFVGPGLLESRWTPGLLAATHLVTVGFMLMVMLGALIQILPVVAGANLDNPLAVARWLHAGLAAGALLLAAGFLLGQAALLGAAALVLGLAVAAFLVAGARALAGVPSTSPTIRGLKLALAGLAGAAGLGVWLALAIANGWAVALPVLADLHAGWALGAWAGVLLAALAYVVVPMFQLTPGYPARPSWWFPGILLGLMVGWALGVVLDAAAAIRLVRALSAVAGIGFALLTLRLQARRRRARSDVTYRYWQLGLASAIFALAMVLTATAWPPLAELTGWSIFAGILLLVGGFMSFIIGMLYKIVPFLAWMHLRNRGSARSPVPNMNRLLPEADAQRQMQAHAVALALLLAAVIAPEWLTRAAGAALAVASGWLLVNLLGAVRRYRQHLDKLDRESVAA
ncbi:MAG: hypothetical protein JNK80_02025 [Dechloromonas sp.]|nr:hypothetical protein [Dechloromonas sp.]